MRSGLPPATTVAVFAVTLGRSRPPSTCQRECLGLTGVRMVLFVTQVTVRREWAEAKIERRAFTMHGIAAGLHTLISLPRSGPTEQELLSAAAAHDLAIGHLGDRWHSPGHHPQGLIIGYGTPPDHAYPAALGALTQVLEM